MAVLDSGNDHVNTLADWAVIHGGATAFIGCITFWAVFGATLYLIL